MDSSIHSFKFKIRCEAEAIPELLEKVFSKLTKYENEVENINFRIEIAAREMLANAIEHGCVQAVNNGLKLEEGYIMVILKISNYNIIFSVKDCGNGFDWENYDLDTMPSLEERGRGLKMINNVADKVEFNQKGNEITIFFYGDENNVKKMEGR